MKGLVPRGPRPKSSDFQKIIIKCILHHSVIQMMDEIFQASEGAVLDSLSHNHGIILSDALFKSFQFAQEFNRNIDLRTTLFNMGFMKQMPNLVKQETSSISLYVFMLGRLYLKAAVDFEASQIESRLIP